MKITPKEIKFIHEWRNDIHRQINDINRQFYYIETEIVKRDILRLRLKFLEDLLSSELVSN